MFSNKIFLFMKKTHYLVNYTISSLLDIVIPNLLSRIRNFSFY
uniref:Uncharacterized protein n=1 Tax=Bartonella schoenbuchensis (strain DSM 13525 / NCTC 13165 / R1) TaxID=687861 RepID=E6YYK3_BARSR|nr:hypothetical protein B11C_20291 [Bartonella schoenbuchensis R1]